MTYLEKLFSFPIKLYDGNEMEKIEERAKSLGIDGEDPTFITTRVYIPITAIIGYHGVYTTPYSIEDAKEKGLNATLIMTETQHFVTSWRPERFVDEYIKHEEFLNANKENQNA